MGERGKRERLSGTLRLHSVGRIVHSTFPYIIYMVPLETKCIPGRRKCLVLPAERKEATWADGVTYRGPADNLNARCRTARKLHVVTLLVDMVIVVRFAPIVEDDFHQCTRVCLTVPDCICRTNVRVIVVLMYEQKSVSCSCMCVRHMKPFFPYSSISTNSTPTD